MILTGLLDYLMTPQLQCLQSFQKEKEDEFQVEEEDSQEAKPVATVEWVDPEPRLSSKAQAVAPELLQRLGLNPLVELNIETSTQLLKDLCLEFELTLLEVEPLLLPTWKAEKSFPSREILFDSTNLESCFQQWPSNGENFEMTMSNQNMEFFFGEFGKTSSYESEKPLFWDPMSGTFQSCRWMELLNGSVLARLLSADLAGLCLDRKMVPERLRITQVLLASLRRVHWAPEHAWIFPEWHQKRMAFISWIGKELGFGVFLWADKVVSFLPIEPDLSS